MKTDSIFYRLFKERGEVFFELIERPVQEAQDYSFASYEVKQTAFRIDGFFQPLQEDTTKPLYFTEVQFRYDANVYAGLFAEIFIYLNQNDPGQDWRGIIIFATRGFEPKNLLPYQELLESRKVTRIYLDELPSRRFRSLNMEIVRLVICDRAVALEVGREVLEQTDEVEDETERLDLLNLITTVLSYKFSDLSREAMEQMFGLDELRQTRFAREMREEGREEGREEAKIQLIPVLLELGLSIDRIAASLSLSVEKVQQAIADREEN